MPTVTQRTYVDVAGLLESEDVQALLAQAGPTFTADWLRQQLDHKIASVTVTAHKPNRRSGPYRIWTGWTADTRSVGPSL